MTQSAHGDLYTGFVEANPAFSPVPIWWWSGDRVELDRLCWQLDRLAEQGVYNAVVLNLAPTGPLYGALADDPPLFSDAWWQLWEGLCAHARTKGFRLWFYDQIGFSGASLQGRIVLAEPEFAGASLERVTADVDGPGELVCPVAGTPIGACALPIDESGKVTGPPVPIPVNDGKVEWTGGGGGGNGLGRHRIMLAYSLRQGFDYMSREACAQLFDIVHVAFERHLASYFGDVIVGSFQDELPSLPMWSPAFPEEFERRRGYRIEPAIAALWEDWGPESVRVRADFQRVRGTLAEEAFFQPLYEWHEKHGLTFGVDQQSPSRTGEPLAGTWQYADYMRTHRWFSAPGSDHHGDAKIHSSLAHHYGRPRTWIESFHSSGWGGTLEETFDWLVPWLLAGATLYDPHAVYYSTHGGWWEWAPPSTCWRQPYWRHYKHFADTVSRLSWLLTRGDHVCDVGILFPSATVQACTFVKGHLPEAKRASDTYNKLIGRMVWYNAKPGVFNRADLDFDVLDDDTTTNASVVDGALRTASESYRAVVLPSASFLEPETAQKLAEFGEAGGLLVVVGDRPEQVTNPSDEAGVQAIQRLRALLDSGSAVHVTDPEAVPAALERLGRRAKLEGPLLHRKVGDRQVALVPASPLGTATKNPIISDTGHWHYDVYQNGYDFDPARYRPKTTIRLTGAAVDVEQWDPLTGLTKPAVTRPVDGDTEVEVDFDSVPAAVLVWTEDDGPAEAAPASVEPRKAVTWKEIPLDAGWASGIVPTTDNRHGDLALPAHEGPLPVQQWRMAHRIDGTDDWSDVVAGYGTFGWIREPGDADWKPLRYSLSRGIQDDPFQAGWLGPKGRVPDEFWHVQTVKKGQTVSLRTALPYAGESPVTLAIGANGSLAARWNGNDLPADPGGYLRLYDVTPDPSGLNQLELDVTADRNGILRGYWALTTDPAAFARPVWLEPGDKSSVGSALSIGSSFELDSIPQQGVLQLGTDGPATLLVNGEEIGTQGAFEPYGSQNRVLPYDITGVLRQGTNTIEVRLTDVGRALAAFVDARFTGADGTSTSVVTDTSWTFERNGVPIPTVVRRSQQYDARWAQLVARPHALPASRWIDADAVEGGVVELVPEARPGAGKAAEWFRVAVPPGAVSATLPVAVDSFQVWLGDEEIAVPAGERTVALADPHGEGRVLTVRVQPSDGRTEGALWDGPATFECGEGRLSPGPWDQAGLASYSGGVTYRKEVTLDESVGQVALDLGTVRGTAEVSVNGTPIGVRIWSPYRFVITSAVQPGVNTIEVTVFNTLGPYLDDASPTRYVFSGQRLSGMLGPVRLLAQES